MKLELALRHGQGAFTLDCQQTLNLRGVTVLFGPSGAGKSTLVRVLAGMVRPTAGRVVLGDQVLVDVERRLNVPPSQRRIGCVFQEPLLFPHLNVRDNLLYGWRRNGRPFNAAVIAQRIELLDLGPLLRCRVQTLSGGERQRVALGRALLCAPRLLLLDEPLSGLDAVRRDDIMRHLEMLRDEGNVPMVYISHSVSEISRLADHLMLLQQGQVVASGSLGALSTRLDLFPLLGRFEAGAVWHVAVQRHEYGLSEVCTQGGTRLWVPALDLPIHHALRVRIRARDVLLAQQRPEGLSARNILAAQVSALRCDQGGLVDVQLTLPNADRLLARITDDARQRLDLKAGHCVWAIVKAVAIGRLGRSAK